MNMNIADSSDTVFLNTIRGGSNMIRTTRWLLALASALCISLPATAGDIYKNPLDSGKGATLGELKQSWRLPMGWELRPQTGLSQGFSIASTDFAILTAVPHAAAGTFEVEMVVDAVTGTSWKAAGLAVLFDKANYWRVALVEAPTDQGSGHFAEFQEMRDGVWLAQGQDKLAPRQLDPLPPFTWEFGKPYKLRIELTEREITGTVMERNGTVRWRGGYQFGAGPAVTSGIPALHCVALKAGFRDIAVDVAKSAPSPEPPKAAAFPPYNVNGSRETSGKATGFFHTERRGGKWWIIDPNGAAYYAVGTDHVTFRGHWCEALNSTPHHKFTLEKYKNETAWADSALARLRQWGFNLLGAGCAPSLFHKGTPHTRFVAFSDQFCSFGDDFRICWPENGSPVPCSLFPNVFHPLWREFCEARAEEVCAGNAADPWLFGYFLDNEVKWWGEWQSDGTGLADSVMSKPATHSAKIVLADWLKERYESIEELNKAWGTNYASFDGLKNATKFEGTEGERLTADKVTFVRLIAERYFNSITAAVRKVDPNHMILGCRFAGPSNPAYSHAYEACGTHSDIVTLNVYGTVNFDTLETADETMPLPKRFSLISEAAGGKPLMVTEWSFPAYDSGLPCKNGAGQRVDTQTERALAFSVYQKMLFAHPDMVGSDYFMWVDEPALGISKAFPEDSNYGLINEKDEPYELLTTAAATLNPKACAIHAGDTAEFVIETPAESNTPVIDQLRWLARLGAETPAQRKAFIVRNSGHKNGTANITFWTDGDQEVETIDLEPGDTSEITPCLPLLTPGAHYLRLAVVSADPSETSLSDNTAERFFLSDPEKVVFPAGVRPLLVTGVANPSEGEAEAVCIVLKGKELPSGVDWNKEANYVVAFDVTQETPHPLNCQIDMLPEGAELAIRGPTLPAYGVATIAVGLAETKRVPSAQSVTVIKDGKKFTIDNSRLKLIHAGDGKLFDQIFLDGVELGQYYPLLQQHRGQNMWTAPNVSESTVFHEGPVRLVVDVVLSRAAGDGKLLTAVGKDGTYEKQTETPPFFNVTFRAEIHQGQPWFSGRLLSVANSDNRPWTLVNSFHYTPPRESGKDDVEAAGQSCWKDAKTGMLYGVADPSGLFSINFWKDAGGGFHSDARLKVEQKLEPGASYVGPEPAMLVGGVKGDSPKALKDFSTRAKAAGKIKTLTQPR